MEWLKVLEVLVGVAVLIGFGVFLYKKLTNKSVSSGGGGRVGGGTDTKTNSK